MTDDLRVLPPAVPRAAPCLMDFEGSPIRAFAGESVAVALWAAGVRTLARSTKFHRPRGAFCFDGHCGSCALRVDGRPNVRACMVPARAGLTCQRQNAFPSAEVDLLAAADWMFPDQMYHHTLLTGNRVANRVLVHVVRQMGGSGVLPDAPAPADRAGITRDVIVDVCVVGAGPAGLTAATTIARLAPRARVLMVDEHSQPGGSWLAEPDGARRAADALHAAATAGVEVQADATAIGFFAEEAVGVDRRADAIRGTLAVVAPPGLWRIAARRIVYATGSYDQPLPFFDNDRPGIVSARACGRLAFVHGLRPGRRVAVVGPAAYGDRLVGGLMAVGIRAEHVQRVDGVHVRLVAARGATWLRGLVVADADGRERRIAADVIAVAATPAPASELPRQHGVAPGADVVLDPAKGGFAALVDAGFQTGARHVFCCGDVTGYVGPTRAERAGAAAGAAIAHTLESP